MKKTYLSALVLGLTSTLGFAQVAQQKGLVKTLPLKSERNFATGVINPAPSTFAPKALGVEIWSDNFDNPGTWTIDNDGQTGATFGWNINSTVESWPASFAGGIVGGSGNFAELGNGNPQAGTQALDVTYTMTSMPIDIPTLSGGSDDVVLKYTEFGARFNDLQEVQISTDGVNYTTVRDNLDYSVLSASGGSAYPNPSQIQINISDLIDGNASNVTIRFSWTTNFPAQSTNSAVWITYGWMIDDVSIETVADNDLTVMEPYWGSEGIHYFQIPNTQIAPIDFSTIIINNGSNTQTNTMLNVDVTGAATYTGASAPQDFVFLEQDTLVTTVPFTPTVNGTYNFTWNVSQDQVEDFPADNGLVGTSFDVVDFIYAVDNGTQTAEIGNDGDPFVVGNLFDAWADQTAYSVEVFIDADSEVGSEIFAGIYAYDGTQSTLGAALSNQVGISDYYVIQAGDLGNFISLPMITPVDLENSVLTYYVAVGSDGDGGATDGAIIGTAGEYQPGVSVYSPDASAPAPSGVNFYRPSVGTPMIRLNFENTASISENTAVSGLSIYPNPATENITVDFNLANASDVTIEVVDAAGKVAIAKTLTSQAAGKSNVSFETAALNAGVYFVNISTEAGKATQKFIKK